ncbi:hypothetical protein ECE50_026410 [Chitinophaga sp. Mgbs1]|uniref:Uncharacterized protein n=1 Tax=Chitinophaga solisilvae TaxID=1233460 RepID=A0A3S1JE51_9BACT|nr:hypothetical protein [Chitinophaga solisilvae]
MNVTSDPAYEDALRQYVSNNDVHHILTKYNVTLKELIDLCGGIQPGTTGFRMEIHTSSEADVIHARIFSDSYDLVRSIDFESKVIFNYFMYVRNQKMGIGTNLLITQVKAARKHCFTKFKTIASAADEEDNISKAGYYCWGRLGYVMRADEEYDFNNWLQRWNRHEKTLFELLSSDDGREVWRRYGYTWNGVFLLDDNTESMNNLKKYLESKGRKTLFEPGSGQVESK